MYSSIDNTILLCQQFDIKNKVTQEKIYMSKFSYSLIFGKKVSVL